MRHRIFGKQLGRTHNQRQALLRSLVTAIFTHGSISTTEAKAKAVLREVEKLASLINKSDAIVASRALSRYIQDKNTVKMAVSVFKATFTGITSNFTKMIRIKRRQGDDAMIVKFSFVKDINFSPKPKEDKKVTKVTKSAKNNS